MACMGENTKTSHKVLVRKPEGERSRGSPGCAWVAIFDGSPK